MYYYQNNAGFIKLIFLIIIIIIILGYFNIDLRGVIEKTQTQENFAYVWQGVISAWNDYILPSAIYLKDLYCSSFIGKPVCEMA